MRSLAILNPRAGVRARRAMNALRNGRSLWPDLVVRETGRPGEARDLASEAARQGCETVLVAGGDGTVNEAAWGLLGSECALGVIPVGSGNGLARALGLSLDPERALVQLAMASKRCIDVGYINGRPFFNVAGAGFDAAVGAAFHRRGLQGGRRGVAGYVRLALQMAVRYESERWTLITDRECFEGRAFVIVFANGRQYGGGAILAPRACFDDGQLDVVVVEHAPFAEILFNAGRLFWGNIEHFRRYRCLRANRAVLTAVRPVDYYRDGEPESGEARLEVRIDPSALSVLVPQPLVDGLFRSVASDRPCDH